MPTITPELEKKAINTIRFLAVDAVENANSGHPGMPMGAAPMAYVLWMRHLRFNPKDPRWPNRDRFVLSAGHGSMLLYALLHLAGFDLTLEDLKKFRQLHSKTPGHPEFRDTPGVEATTGPLGQGMGNAVGMALSQKMLAARVGGGLIDGYVYGICSDGDLMEGVSAEASSLAGHLELGNLIFLYDDNRVSLAGHTDVTFTEDRLKRYDAYGWHTQQVEDGNDTEAIDRAIRAAKAQKERPSLIAVRTVIGYGSPHKADTHEVHGAPLGKDEVRATKQALGWPLEPAFLVPDEVRALWAARVEELKSEYDRWQQKLAQWRKDPAHARLWDTFARREVPEDVAEQLAQVVAGIGGEATRKVSQAVLQKAAELVPSLVGGSADLDPSTFTYIKGGGDVKANGYDGRNIHFGVREHGMGSIVNGFAYDGFFIPYGATFLLFSDYMRPPIRLSALSRLQSLFVFTHDSIFLGEDGPTHEPVEHLASLRAMPGLVVIRPADAAETAEAWKVALERRDGPTALILSRQDLPVLDRGRLAPAGLLARGAYVLADAHGQPEDLILLASGSEVPVALATADLLQSEHGLSVRVVSMPSWELFEQQGEAYRGKVLPPDIPVRLAVEAATPLGWTRWVGNAGAVVGVDRFGASAPGSVVLEQYGFTAENVAARALELLRTSGLSSTLGR